MMRRIFLNKRMAMLPALTLLFLPMSAMAHVAVEPSTAGVGSEQVFRFSVPNERQSNMNRLQITIPEGVSDVMPTAAAGWMVETTRNKSNTTEISWTGGELPSGQRAEFSISAQAPAKPGEVHWKVYQYYADGSKTSWTQTPSGDDDAEGDTGPYAVTKVVDDLTSVPKADASAGRATVALALSAAALAISAVAAIRKR